MPCFMDLFAEISFSDFLYSNDYFLLISIMATIGAPTRAATLLTGRAPSKPGRRESKLQIKVRSMPENSVAGISQRWSDVRNMARARCGTARPMNIDLMSNILNGRRAAITMAKTINRQPTTTNRQPTTNTNPFL